MDGFVKGYDGDVIENSVILTIEADFRAKDNVNASSAYYVAERRWGLNVRQMPEKHISIIRSFLSAGEKNRMAITLHAGLIFQRNIHFPISFNLPEITIK